MGPQYWVKSLIPKVEPKYRRLQNSLSFHLQYISSIIILVYPGISWLGNREFHSWLIRWESPKSLNIWGYNTRTHQPSIISQFCQAKTLIGCIQKTHKVSSGHFKFSPYHQPDHPPLGVSQLPRPVLEGDNLPGPTAKQTQLRQPWQRLRQQLPALRVLQGPGEPQGGFKEMNSSEKHG